MDKKSLILVSGATGQQGGAVADQLLSKGYNVRAMTRKPAGEKAKALTARGAEVMRADLDDPPSLEHVLEGVSGVFAVQNTWEAGVEREETQGKRFAEMARSKGVQHFVYTSVASAGRSTGIPHFDNKWRVEEKIRALKFPSYTILRPVFFMDNFLSPWFKPGIDQGKLMMALKPETVLQMIAVEDIGQFGLRAFEKDQEMNGLELDIAGDQHTMPEVAETISKAAGKPVEFTPVPIEEVREMSGDYAAMLEWFDRVGYNADIPGLQQQYGLKLSKLAEWAARAKWA